MSRRLLPSSTAANYAALVAASINTEGLVNGVWVSCVSFTAYSISLKLAVETLTSV